MRLEDRTTTTSASRWPRALDGTAPGLSEHSSVSPLELKVLCERVGTLREQMDSRDFETACSTIDTVRGRSYDPDHGSAGAARKKLKVLCERVGTLREQMDFHQKH